MGEFVSLVTLNYNGKKFLKSFFVSAFAIDYPKKDYEVIMVDNNSTDGSVEFVKENFPEVKIIDAGANLGFGRGNNLGIKAAKGELVFLLNNDTILEKESVKEIVNCFSRWSKKEKIGAVNAKLVLVDYYLPIQIKEGFFVDVNVVGGTSPINEHVFVIPQETKESFLERILLPVGHETNSNLELKIVLKPYNKSFDRKRSTKVLIGNEVFYSRKFEKMNERDAEVKINISKKEFARFKTDLIQNAGSFYFRDGFGRDRGVVVFKNRQFFEVDNGQYDDEEYVHGFCGAGVLLNKKAIEDVGYFDDDFFLYYEDAELSFRMRENGWRNLYCPSSLIRHIHSATNKEWSDFFIYHVERSRLLFVAKHWPRLIAVQEFLKYLFKDTFAVPAYYFIKSNLRESLRKLRVRLKVILSILVPFPLSLTRTKRLSNDEVKGLY